MAKLNGPKTKVAKRPEDRPIDATGCFGLCCYNIPQGTLIVLLPGLTMLCIGIALIAAYPLEMLSLLMVCLGAGMTVGALLYWVIMWCRYRPQKIKKSPLVPVQLVGIYNINMEQNGMSNPAYVP